MALSDVMARIDALLRGFTPAMRAPTVPIETVHESVEEIGEEPMHQESTPIGQVHYLLAPGGAPPGLLSRISGSTTLRRALVRLDLMIYNGGETSPAWFKEQALALQDAWGQVQSLLEDPNNWNKPATGWIQAREFTAGPPTPEEDRIVIRSTFVVTFRERYVGQAQGSM